MSNETFYKILTGIAVVIVICGLIIGIRTYQDKKQIAKQKEMLEQKLEAIFEAEVEVGEEVKEDSVINIAVVGDILCGNAMLADAKNGEEYNLLLCLGILPNM